MMEERDVEKEKANSRSHERNRGGKEGDIP